MQSGYYNYLYAASQAPVGEDVPQFSQAGSTFGDAPGQSYDDGDQDDEGVEEEDVPTSGTSRAAEPSGHPVLEPDSDGQIEIASSRKHRKRDKDERKHVTIQQHKKGGGFYFVNVHGLKVDTPEKKWKEVEDGYEYKGQKLIYFSKGFPK